MESRSAEIQVLAIGDIAFVGVPGELLVEPGFEIKWHSPFRKTYILYNSTGYIGYIPHVNTYVSGGYESGTSRIGMYSAFNLVKSAVSALQKLYFEIHNE